RADAQARVAQGRVGELVAGVPHLGVEAQPEGHTPSAGAMTLQLTDGVEDHLVAEAHDLVDLRGVVGDAVAVRLSAELLASEPRFVEAAARRAREEAPHEIEGAPRGEALERQQAARPGALLDVPDPLQGGEHAGLFDEVVGGLHESGGGRGTIRRGAREGPPARAAATTAPTRAAGSAGGRARGWQGRRTRTTPARRRGSPRRARTPS